MAQQTAVEWFFETLLKSEPHILEWQKIFEQAKAMEKEQIKDAMMYALDEDGHTGDWKVKFIEDYINKKLHK